MTPRRGPQGQVHSGRNGLSAGLVPRDKFTVVEMVFLLFPSTIPFFIYKNCGPSGKSYVSAFLPILEFLPPTAGRSDEYLLWRHHFIFAPILFGLYKFTFLAYPDMNNYKRLLSGPILTWKKLFVPILTWTKLSVPILTWTTTFWAYPNMNDYFLGLSWHEWLLSGPVLKNCYICSCYRIWRNIL